ncbi:MAG: MCE family protein [Planctomycetes bacterium]|nr:MCE family protein [Planctomycetota bacterium]
MNARRYLVLACTFLAGIVFLSSYTFKLSYEELREWQTLEAVVDNVGGLKELDEVQIRGSRQGRVVAIELYKSRQKLTLEVVPGLVLHEDYAIEIVPKNALGAMAVRISPGNPRKPQIDPSRLLKASLREGVGVGQPTPGRREAIRESFARVAEQTAALRDPASGVAGAVLFDRQRVRDLRVSMSELDDQWSKIDAALAEIEAEQGLGRFLLSSETLLAVGETIDAGREILTRMQTGLATANSGDAASGGWLGDPVRAAEVRQALAEQAEAWAAVREGEGLLGRALDPGLADELEGQLAPVREAAAEGAEERGLLGVLSSEEVGEWAAQAASNLPRSLERIRTQLAETPDSTQALRDGAANVDDALVNFQRGMTYLKRGLMPARTSFANGLFAVF